MKTKHEEYTPQESKTYADGLSAAMCFYAIFVLILLSMLQTGVEYLLTLL